MDLGSETISELGERDINIIETIHREDLTCFSFEGLKRILQIHPETLSRIINRLTEEKILKKGKNQYTLTKKAKQLIKFQNPISKNSNLPLLQSFLPPQIRISDIFSKLRGKWFGNLRWLGFSTTNIT